VARQDGGDLLHLLRREQLERRPGQQLLDGGSQDLCAARADEHRPQGRRHLQEHDPNPRAVGGREEGIEQLAGGAR
jgi:hypothetical protein